MNSFDFQPSKVKPVLAEVLSDVYGSNRIKNRSKLYKHINCISKSVLNRNFNFIIIPAGLRGCLLVSKLKI